VDRPDLLTHSCAGCGARWFGLDLFCAFEYVHLMQLMFFLSGLFVW
jgi:hypothetical protein